MKNFLKNILVLLLFFSSTTQFCNTDIKDLINNVKELKESIKERDELNKKINELKLQSDVKLIKESKWQQKLGIIVLGSITILFMGILYSAHTPKRTSK